MPFKLLLPTLLCTLFSFAEMQAASKGKAEHVVVVVWDGMRPDFITPQYCPTLYSLATNGVFFRNHHPSFISTTEVNGAALATGMYPGANGILANVDYQPELSVLGGVATESVDSIRRGDLLSGGKYIRTPTIPELLHQAGIATIIAGSKPVALFHDRSTRRSTKAEKESLMLHDGKTIPRAAGEGLPKVNDDKSFPTNITQPNLGQDNWTTRSLIRSFWKKDIPKYTLLWLSDPDKSQHETGVGSSTALAGIEASDNNLAEVVKTLKEKGVWEKTDIMVVSDHGFSTIYKAAAITENLRRHRFKAHSKLDDNDPGNVVVVGLGGAALFYVIEHQESVIHRLVEFLQNADFTGVIFSRQKIEGTFPLETIKYPTDEDAPDLVVAMRWKPDLNTNGAPGLVTSVGGTIGKGTHGSLSRFDMNNTLVASGPDFKRGFINHTPSGNVDVGPTVLHLLGVTPPPGMSGRVLREALVSAKTPLAEAKVRTIEAKHETGLGNWTQYLKISEVDGTSYFDEGNGALVPR